MKIDTEWLLKYMSKNPMTVSLFLAGIGSFFISILGTNPLNDTQLLLWQNLVFASFGVFFIIASVILTLKLSPNQTIERWNTVISFDYSNEKAWKKINNLLNKTFPSETSFSLEAEKRSENKMGIGALFLWWQKTDPKGDKAWLRVEGYYDEKLEFTADGKKTDLSWVVCGSSDQPYTAFQRKTKLSIPVTLIQKGIGREIPFHILFTAENGHISEEFVEIKDDAERIVARAKLTEKILPTDQE